MASLSVVECDPGVSVARKGNKADGQIPLSYEVLELEHRRAIIEEMKSLSLGFIQKDMYDQYFNEKDQ